MELTNREKEVIEQSLSNTIKVVENIINPHKTKAPIVINTRTQKVLREYNSKLKKIISRVNKNPEELTHYSMDIILEALKKYKDFIDSQYITYPTIMYITGNDIDENAWRKSNEELSAEVNKLIEKIKIVRFNQIN